MSAENLRPVLFIDNYFPVIDGVTETVHEYARHMDCPVVCPAMEGRYLEKNDFPYEVLTSRTLRAPFTRYASAVPKLDGKLASVGDYVEHGADIITLRFCEDGSAYIHQDCRCQGSSAGQIGGGEISVDIPDDFYLSLTCEQIAKKCWHSGDIVANGKLAAFLEKVKSKGGFLLDFTKPDEP